MKNKSHIISVIILLSVCLFSFTGTGNYYTSEQEKSGTIYFVRHAEKEKTGEDPLLTKHGRKRAQELANYLLDKNIEGVYSTDFARTKNTAKPIADKMGIEIEVYSKKKVETLMKKIVNKGGNRLIVGHWGTANDAFEYFKTIPQYDTEEVNNYNSVLKVSYSDNTLVEAILLKY